jgi:hypothetical protein
MSIHSETKEIDGIIDRLLHNLVRDNQPGLPGAALRRQCGIVLAHHIDQMYEGTFGENLLACFTAAVETKIQLPSLVFVHEQLFLEEPVGEIASALVLAAVLFCLATESRLIIKMEFTSRDDVQMVMDESKETFDLARQLTADRGDSGPYQTLNALAGSLTQHLTTIARPLPRMISFTLATHYPALALSQRIYYTAERWEEVYAENKPVHPLFCQRVIVGLSS